MSQLKWWRVSPLTNSALIITLLTSVRAANRGSPLPRKIGRSQSHLIFCSCYTGASQNPSSLTVPHAFSPCSLSPTETLQITRTPALIGTAITCKTFTTAHDPSYPLNSCFTLLTCGHRYRSVLCKKACYS